MKITLRNPISISRLKRRPCSQLTNNQKENFNKQTNQLKFDDLSTENFSKQVTSSKQITVLAQRKYFKNKQNQISHLKKQNKTDQKKKFLINIQSLEYQNKRLNQENLALRQIVKQQAKQKQILEQRVNKFEDKLINLQAQYQQEFGRKDRNIDNNEKKILRINNTKIQSLKQKPIDIKNQIDKPFNEGRRMSLQDTVTDLSTKLKQYKNQVQIQKRKRLNLQQELQVYKQNIRIEAKLEIQSLVNKITTMKETLDRKNKQIIQKQQFIQKLISH